jgi:hypothetical protein
MIPMHRRNAAGIAVWPVSWRLTGRFFPPAKEKSSASNAEPSKAADSFSPLNAVRAEAVAL